MASLTDTELIRARWRRHLRDAALDTTEHADFAQRGLAARIQDLSFRLLLLPYDPDHEQFEIDDVAAQLENHRSMTVGNGSIHFGARVIPTAHAAALVTRPGDGAPWERFVAIHRNGAVELGLGDRHRRFAGEDESKFVELITSACFAWATLELARHINSDADAQPQLLALALPDAAGSLLRNLGAGYAEPGSYYNQMPGCPDDHLLWHIELDRPPADPDEVHAIALNVASRITHAWGATQTFYLDREGDMEGHLNIRRAER